MLWNWNQSRCTGVSTLFCGYKVSGCDNIQTNSQELRKNCGDWPGYEESLIRQQNDKVHKSRELFAHFLIIHILHIYLDVIPMPNLWLLLYSITYQMSKILLLLLTLLETIFDIICFSWSDVKVIGLQICGYLGWWQSSALFTTKSFMLTLKSEIILSHIKEIPFFTNHDHTQQFWI